MKLQVKSALLSALVFPGLGQVLKGSKIKGFILIAATNLLLVAAFALVLKVVMSGILPAGAAKIDDPAQIARAIEPAVPGLKWVMRIFACVWLYGALDALFAPRRRSD